MKHLWMSLIVWAALAAGGGPAAAADSCSDQVAQFEDTVRQSASAPLAVPTEVESTAAKLGHQPTPGSVNQAKEQARSRLAELVARAKVLDANGDRAGCLQALADAKLVLDLP